MSHPAVPGAGRHLARHLHMDLNVLFRRKGLSMEACDGPECEVCERIISRIRCETLPHHIALGAGSLEALIQKWRELGEVELREATDREMPAAMGVAAMRLHCANELEAWLASAGRSPTRMETSMIPNAEGREAPRRCYIELMTPAECAIREAILAVERLPADARLTNAVVLLDQAKNWVADYVDGLHASPDPNPLVPVQPPPLKE